MKPYSFLAVLCVLLHSASSQKCDLSGAKKPEVEFPDFADSNEVFEYTLSVEYTVPGANQTDYYIEYFDAIEKRGRVDGYQAGKFSSYMYFTESMEAWELTERTCKLQNLTDIPALMRNDMTDWMYFSTNGQRKAFGPSAMFMKARDVWKSSEKASKMAYMGESTEKVRGVKAQFWRRCDADTSNVIDYYFTSDSVTDPLDLNRKRIPLRVHFEGTRNIPELSVQNFDIMLFKPFIQPSLKPFRLPKGRGCRRGKLNIEPPKMPDFSTSSLQFSADVIYRKIGETGADTEYWSYYSTLMMAIDNENDHLAYSYSPWSSEKPGKEEPSVDPPISIIYDFKDEYAYMKNLLEGHCDIKRQRSFVPTFKLPKDAGEISLTDQSILFPNNEAYFLSEGETRGLEVNIFEETIQNYFLGGQNGSIVPKAIISRSYLKKNEKVITKSFVKEALAEIQLIFSGRQEKVKEVITFNFYGFSTEISDRRSKFNIQKCHNADYFYVTLGFKPDNNVLNDIKEQIPSIQTSILSSVSSILSINPIRVPNIFVDINNGLYVTMMILEKPPVSLDYLPAENDRTISGSAQVNEIQDFDSCASECLEKQDNCWGISMCGSTCTHGTSETAKTVDKKGCYLYRRYSNDSYVPSSKSLILDFKDYFEARNIKLELTKRDGGIVQLECTSIEVNDPREKNKKFNTLGN